LTTDVDDFETELGEKGTFQGVMFLFQAAECAIKPGLDMRESEAINQERNGAGVGGATVTGG
jgi:hypothetical protein